MGDCFIVRRDRKSENELPYYYGENIFNFEAFKKAIGSNIYNGSVVWGDNSFTLTANATDCFTMQDYSPRYTLDKTGIGTYELSYDYVGSYGRVLVFFNGSTSRILDRGNSSATKIGVTLLTDNSYITIRFGVQNTGTSCTYSNIKLRKLLLK